ncbi:hypothetical protein MTR67_030723 [Solanum verrucosum]|uniref:Uncharacterized protein n=1 Tax=Solanum verrucosum TaxID=315347 RepID=A0AAF0ZEZ9_SOLVR|nr:hypothetical protein MTR67_030723 [Solanum verrucosum]
MIETSGRSYVKNRTFMAIIGGVIAGILGLNSLTGFYLLFSCHGNDFSRVGVLPSLARHSLRRPSFQSTPTLTVGTESCLMDFLAGLWYFFAFILLIRSLLRAFFVSNH